MADGLERLGGEIEEQRSSMKQVGAATMIGSALEWYDFFLWHGGGWSSTRSSFHRSTR